MRNQSTVIIATCSITSNSPLSWTQTHFPWRFFFQSFAIGYFELPVFELFFVSLGSSTVKAGFHWRQSRSRSRKSASVLVKIENRSRKRNHKLDGIGVGRIRTVPFSSDSAYDSDAYDPMKTRLSESQAEAEEPTNHIAGFIPWLPLTETGHLVPKPFRPRTLRPQVWLTRPQMQFTTNVNPINVFVEMIVKS